MIKFSGLFGIFITWIFSTGLVCADSDLFPAYENAPALTSYVSGGTYNNVYYLSPTGDDVTGNGSIDNPWLSFRGATSGGRGTPVSAGDIIYLRGGTYPVHARASWMKAYYALERSGTANDYIVVTKYPGETPVFTGAKGSPSFSIHGDYVVLDGISFADGAGFYFNNANYGVVQNSTFGACSDPWGDQISGVCIGLNNNVRRTVIRNNYFGPSSVSHAIKNYTSTSITSDVQVLYNRFHNITVSYGTINHKGVTSNWEYAYNRFEGCRYAVVWGTTYNNGIHTGANIHHNAFDNVYGVILDHNSFSTGDIRELNFQNNIVLGAASQSTKVLRLRCSDAGCWNNDRYPMGEFYNNVFYATVDIIDPETTINFINYPRYWNYNAYRTAASRDSAENQNNLVSWQAEHILVAEDAASSRGDILEAGTAGDRFYYITDDSKLRGKGRLGTTIGGFIWLKGNASPRPPELMVN